MYRRTILSVLAAATIWIGVLIPGAAAGDPPPGLTMEATAVFEGYVKYGEWLPVWVYLENQGPDLDGQVQVGLAGSSGRITFAAPASLPSGSRKRVLLYVLPNNYSHELEVQFFANDRVLAAQQVAVNPRPNITYLVGLAAAQRGALAFLPLASLPGQNRSLEAVDVSLANLPGRPEGLRSLDCLVLNDVDTSTLTPDQQAALEAWVRQGGRLVVGGGAGARRTAAGLPASLLPVVPHGDASLDALPALASLAAAEAIRVPGPFLVATGDVVGGQTLAAQGELPLVQEQTLGAGSIDWLALDLSTLPFDAWTGTTALWQRLLAPGSTYPAWLAPDMSPRQMQSRSMTYALNNLPALDLPSVQGLALLLGVYILAVGPANYVLLRWRKRLQWAWVTIPALTILFAVGAFSVGYLLRGSDLILNRVAVINLDGDGTANVRAYIGLFSPAQQSYEIQVEGGPLLSPLIQDYNPWGPGASSAGSEMAFVQADPGLVRGLAVNQWSMQSLMAEGSWSEFGRIAADLQVEGSSLVGQVQNNTSHTIADAVLILGDQFLRLGDLPPGGEAAVTLALGRLTGQRFGPPLSYRLFESEFNQPGPNGPSREAQLKQTIVDSVFQQGGKFGPAPLASWGGADLQGLVLIGWLDEAPPFVSVAGRVPMTKTTALLYTPLSFRLPTGGAISMPPGLIPATLIEVPTEGGMCGVPGTAGVYIGRGQAVFEFQLPTPDEVRADEIELVLGSDGGWWQPPAVDVYDWPAGDWQPLENAVQGSNVLSQAGRFVGDDGRFRVRLSSEGGTNGCAFVDLGLKGTRP